MRRTRPELLAPEAYWKEATDFVKRMSDDPKNPAWVAVSREMPEQIEAWKKYFRWRLGYVTRGLSMLEENKIETFLVPTEWPQWFDAKWSAAA